LTAQAHPQPFYRVLLSATGITLLAQGVALFRQILIVGYFGLSRDLDLYSTVYAMAVVTAFAFNIILENTCMSILVGIRDAQGEAFAARVARQCLFFGALFGLASTIVFAVITPLLSIVYAAGFSGEEHGRLLGLAVYFLPWALISPIYFVAMASLKSLLHYKSAFCAELIVALVSTLLLVCFHSKISYVPLAYAGGYMSALAMLLVLLYRVKAVGNAERISVRAMVKRISAYFFSNQASIPGAMAERFWFSFLPPGGISALALVQQLVMNLSGLLAFRDIYLVPLLPEANRKDKLRRLLLGMAYITLPVVVFVAMFSTEIMHVMFGYGKVTAADIDLTACLLSISMIGLFVTVVLTPCWRLLQTIGMYRPVTIFYVASAVSTMLLGAILIRTLDLGVIGMVLISVINAIGGGVYLYKRYARGSLRLHVQDCLLVLSGLAVSLGAAYIASLFSSPLPKGLLSLAITSAVYFTLVGLYAFLRRGMLKDLLEGRGGVTPINNDNGSTT